ncbi:hypothetical protein E0H73_34195 [Kribbella pittospori]|uniref:Uncharacterized protein n=1 Tax=Kribbella pittospori TaxID=722689 RepID=A0A4R0KCY8_9ACTN|nr:hypothetical protein [Kribbella pittospori]TCC56206.1 hypothetical protein E0H73_34195 [Kribbella pittospori]
MAASEPDPVRARHTTTRLLWACAVLTVLVAVFQLAGILSGNGEYDALAWVGVGVTAVCLLALVGIYCLCALDRLSLRTRVFRFDLFQVTTVLLLVAIVAGVLVPTRNTTALALLLPWGLTYWLHNLNQPAE